MANTNGWASSLAEAKRNATVNMIGPSGSKFSVRPLTLVELAAEEALPDDLFKVAILEQVDGGVVAQQIGLLQKGNAEALEESRKLSRDTLELRNRIVLKATVAPALKPSDLKLLDPFDIDAIARVAQHRLTVDEDGGLVDPLATFQVATPK
jgi:hypothetical protein